MISTEEGCGISDVVITQKDMEHLLNTQVLVWNPLCHLDAQQCAESASSLTQNHWLRCRLPGADFSLALLASPVSLEQILN